MCYRCEVCSVIVPAREKRRLHRIYRTIEEQVWSGTVPSKLVPRQRKEIAREIPVCGRCEADLCGVPLPVLQRVRVESPSPTGKSRIVHAPDVVPAPVRTKGVNGVVCRKQGLGEILKR